jgi:hypothetical protein
MGKCYTLSFDPVNGTGPIGQRVYNVDWSFLPLGKRFKVRFSYMSQSDGTILGGDVMTLMMNLGQSNNYVATLANGLQSTQYLGNLKIGRSSAPDNHGYYYADVDSNPPIYLEQRPAQNVITVQLNSSIEIPSTPFSLPAPLPYVLTLAFEEVE